jgi:hypothetical protein
MYRRSASYTLRGPLKRGVARSGRRLLKSGHGGAFRSGVRVLSQSFIYLLRLAKYSDKTASLRQRRAHCPPLPCSRSVSAPFNTVRTRNLPPAPRAYSAMCGRQEARIGLRSRSRREMARPPSGSISATRDGGRANWNGRSNSAAGRYCGPLPRWCSTTIQILCGSGCNARRRLGSRCHAQVLS